MAKPSGFPKGTRYTPIPNPLLGTLLTEIEDIAEFKIILRVTWMLAQTKGYNRFVTIEEIISDGIIRITAGKDSDRIVDVIKSSIQMAVHRDILVTRVLLKNRVPVRIYTLNDEASKVLFSRMEREGLLIEDDSVTDYLHNVIEVEVPTRPNIYSLYEDNIGLLTPLLVDKLNDAERLYPDSWIRNAFEVAVSNNVRNWGYIEGTLRKWETEGKDDGKSRRHFEKVSLKEYVREQRANRGDV